MTNGAEKAAASRLDRKPLSTLSKFAYGFGQIAEGVKNTGLEIVLFFYYTQVLGLSGIAVGAAVLWLGIQPAGAG